MNVDGESCSGCIVQSFAGESIICSNCTGGDIGASGILNITINSLISDNFSFNFSGTIILLQCTIDNLFIFAIIGPPSGAQLRLKQHGRHYLIVSWNPPYDGGYPLNYYILHFSNNISADSWSNFTFQASDSLQYITLFLFLCNFFYVNENCRQKFENLTMSQDYYFKIQTFNVAYEGPIQYFNFTTDSGN